MTAITRIIEWINEEKHPVWWRHGVRLLIEKGNLTVNEQELLFRIARKDAGFPEDMPQYTEYEQPIKADGFGSEEEPVVLVSLGPTNNVAALSGEQEITFSESGLNIIYGDNGAGKSSYARILKNACLTRGDKPPVIGNAFEKNSSKPASKVTFKVGGGEPQAIEWTYGGEEIQPLKSIRIFDTRSANHYVEKEGELGYAPAGLHLLEGLTGLCRYIKSEADRKIKSSAVPVPLPKVEEGTESDKFLKRISHETTSLELDAQCVTDEESATLEVVQKEVLILQTQTPAEIRKGITKRIQLFSALDRDIKTAYSEFGPESLKGLADSRANHRERQEVADALKGNAFSDMPIREIGSDAWLELWKAAKAFILKDNPEKKFPPEAGEICPLCVQEVSNESAARLSRFENFVANEAKESAEKLKKEINERIGRMRMVNFNINQHSAAVLELKDAFPLVSERVEVFARSFAEIKSVLLSEEGEPKAVIQLDVSSINNISQIIDGLSLDLATVNNDGGVEKLYEEKRLLLRSLMARKSIADGRDSIEREIKRRKAVHAYEKIREKTNPSLITRQSTLISATYVTDNLKKCFEEELFALGFKNYEVVAEFRGSEGAQLFKIRIPNGGGASVSSIASEGEQKCLALAAIFAELKSDNRKSCVVFDDPVNSLDHRWRDKVAERLVSAASDIQVVIFTHDIVFLKRLLEISEVKGASSVKICSLNRSRRAAGYVRDAPPWDALTTGKRVSSLRIMHQRLAKLEQDGLQDEYDISARALYGRMREAWERLVEEKLLNKVVERFGRGVSTQRLKRLTDISDEDIVIIDRAMTKCSTLLDGHDSAPEIHQAMPSPEEVLADIEELGSYCQQLTEKRKRN